MTTFVIKIVLLIVSVILVSLEFLENIFARTEFGIRCCNIISKALSIYEYMCVLQRNVSFYAIKMIYLFMDVILVDLEYLAIIFAIVLF